MAFLNMRIFTPSGKTDQDSILLHPNRARWARLNSTAREIVETFQKTESADDAAAVLSRRYSRDFGSCLADVQSTLDRLTKEGYLEGRRDAVPLERSGLRQIHLHITSRCNLTCDHCLGECSPSEQAHLGRKKIFALIDQSRALGATTLVLSGGEPLLHPDIKNILRYAADRMKIHFATNGTLIDASWAAFLAETPVHIQISLDGPAPEIHDSIRGPGTFAKTVEAIGRLQKAGAKSRLTLATTMMNQNIRNLDETIALARRLEIPRIRFLPLLRRGRALLDWPKLEAEQGIELSERFYDRVRRSDFGRMPALRISSGLSGFVPQPSEHPFGDDVWCPIGSQLIVAADGRAYACGLLCRKDFVLGDTHRLPLSRILESRKWKGMILTLLERKDRIRKCAECLWKNLCQAGCMGLAYDRYGSVWETDDFCSYRKRAYAEAFQEILNRPAPPRKKHVPD